MGAIIQFYTAPTPNGQKVGAALEVLGLEYEVHHVAIFKGEQFSPEYKKVNPNSKIPAIVDPDGPDGQSITVCESGAILLYLAEKTGKLLPKDVRKKTDTIQWLLFEASGLSVAIRELAHYTMFFKDRCADPYPAKRYTAETERAIKLLDEHLKGESDGKEFISADELTVADVAIYPWISALLKRRGKLESSETGEEFTHVTSWAKKLDEKYPALARGIAACDEHK